MRFFSRAGSLIAALVVVALAGAAFSAEKESFAIVRHELRVPGLAAAHDGLKVVHLTDLHIGASTPDARIRAAVSAINAEQPALVLMTGDYATFSKRPIGRIGPLLAGLKAPVFAVLGNHDHWTDAKAVATALREQGYTVLGNEWRTVTVQGAALHLVGVDDAKTEHDDVAKALHGLPAGGGRLVLAHAPSTADDLPESSGFVVLSGHTHGGQVVVPGVTKVAAKIVGEPYLRGFYEVRGNLLFVSSGLGYGKGGAAVRVAVPPEIVVFTLRPGK